MTQQKSYALERLRGELSSAMEQGVVDNHTHLGGSVPIRRLWEQGEEQGIRGMGRQEQFARTLHLTRGSVGTLDDYVRAHSLAERIQSGRVQVAQALKIAVLEMLHAHGSLRVGPEGVRDTLLPIKRLVVRADVFKRTGVIPTAAGPPQGLYDVDQVVQALSSAAQQIGVSDKSVEVSIILIFSRDIPIEIHKIQAEKIREWRRMYQNIVGVDLAGPESRQPFTDQAALESFADYYDMAAGEILGRTAHVGETQHTSLETFIETLRALKPHRVSHPLVAFKEFWENGDDRGLQEMAERKITIEFCPWSNWVSHAVKELSDFRKLFDLADNFEIPWVICTDNPALHKKGLAQEIEWLLENYLITPEQLYRALSLSDKVRFFRGS